MCILFYAGSRVPEQGPAVPGGSGGEVSRIDGGGTGTTATTGAGGAPRAADEVKPWEAAEPAVMFLDMDRAKQLVISRSIS